MNAALLAQELERDEALRLKPYTDSVGKLSIGVGRNLTDKGISAAEASILLQDDIAEVVADLDFFLPWWRDMDEVRQRVLANMCFNLGIIKLMMFKNTLAAMKAGAYERAARGMQASLWARQVGQRAQRLVAMMRTGNA